MKVAAIISEYNPFHLGHEYQVKELRRILGEDTAVIAIMSGNFTQRAEPAVCDKTIRAKAACECGINLVLELPFPFCMSSAEFFAKSGVLIASKIGIVDYLAFGSESGDISEISNIASTMTSDEYKLTLDDLASSADYKEYGYRGFMARIFHAISLHRITFWASSISRLFTSWAVASLPSQSSARARAIMI